MKQLLLALALAFVLVMGREVTAPPPKAAAEIPFGMLVSKSCTSATVAIGATTTCTITLDTPAVCCFPGDIVLTVQNQQVGQGPNNTFGRVQLTNASNAVGIGIGVTFVLNNPPDGSPQTMTITCVGGCFFFGGEQIIITEVMQGLVGGNVTQTLQFGPLAPEVLTQTVQVLPSPVGASVVCVPPTIVANSGPGGQSTCTATFSDSDLFTNAVSSANVNLTLTGTTGAVLTATGNPTGNFRCGPLFNMPQGCTTLPFTVQSNTVLTGNIGVQLTYVPDLAAVNGQYLNAFANVLTATPAAPVPIPNTPASLVVSGPASIACGATGNITATLRDGGGTLVAAPTQVSFNTSLGIIASPSMTAAGVATTTMSAPAAGAGGSAQVTATAAGLTAQTLVQLGACAAAPAPPTPASLSVSGPASIACGATGNVTATLRDGGGVVIAAPTQVSFTTTLGIIGSPTMTAAGVATTNMTAPATGSGGSAQVTATAAGLTAQTLVPVGACAAAPTPATPASLVVAGPGSISCGSVGNVTATLRDGSGTLIATPTQVGFSTSAGVVASPGTTASGVATSTLAAPASGAGGTALVTATSAGLTGQTAIVLGACATAPTTNTTTNNTTNNTTTNNTTSPVQYVPFYQPALPYYPPPAPFVPQPAPPQQPIVNVTVQLPPNAFPQQPAAAPSNAGTPPQQVNTARPAVAPITLKPPSTGDAGLKADEKP